MPTNRIHINNYQSTINESGGLSNSDTTITVTSATGLPTLSGSEYYMLTLDDGTNKEIVKVTARTSNDLTVTRGQDGTSGTAFADGTTISARVVRESLDTKAPLDEDILPDTTSTYDLGSGTYKFVDLHLSGNVNVDGTVDGRDVAADGTKLDGIETAADVTDETNVKAALDGATISSATVATGDKVLIQDVDDSDNLKYVTAQSIADLAGGGGAWQLITTATPSGAASVDFTGLSSSYHAYAIVMNNITPSTDDVAMYVRTDSDGGASFDSTSGNYMVVIGGLYLSAATTVTEDQTGNNSIGQVQLNSSGGGIGWGSAANESGSGIIYILDPSNASYTHIQAQVTYANAGGYYSRYYSAGQRVSTTAVDAVQVLFNTGNISGELKLYGLSAS